MSAIVNHPCTRRQTLIWGGASIAGLASLSPVLARGADRPLIIMENARGMVVADPVLCVGCGRCELACTEFNDGRASPSLARIKIDRNMNFGPQGVPSWREGHGNMGNGLVIQDLCRQCPHPVPCANICPEKAIVLSKVTGARIVDTGRCTGCKICLKACPWEMISYDPEHRQATKCHLCEGKPKCVEACPAGALSYVSWRDLTGRIPPRNPKPASLPFARTLSCRECHLPAQGRNIREIVTLLRRMIGGGSAKDGERIGLRWVDLVGTVLVPAAFVSVLAHGFIRRMKEGISEGIEKIP
ncbi:MAG: 4Fe-4S dicluster domain-containing protein [Syntrophobacterales bacterium]|nr:4Fe-4S dicluster domain-containing protein [Syntrophobacterales bacterium]